MTPSQHGFPRTCRLLRPSDFARVYGARRSAVSGPLVIYAANREAGTGIRIGFSVSRRIGNAVVRNRWKRRLREAFRMARNTFPPGHDFIVVVRSGLPAPGAAELRQTAATLATLAARAVRRPEGSRPPRGRGEAG